MTEPTKNPIDTIEAKLPNGFHDAALYELRLDREARELALVLGADVSEVSPDNSSIVYRRCRLRVPDLLFLYADVPLLEFADGKPSEMKIDMGELEGDRLLAIHGGELPKGSYAHWIYLYETNGFVYLIARGATFEWLEQPTR